MFQRPALRADWQIAAAATVALRVLYSAIAAAFSLILHPDAALIRSNALTENLPDPHGLHYALLGIWERFDTLWFLRIAGHGYDRPMSVIFYPLYPAVIRLLSALMPAIAAALVISTLATFHLLWGLLHLAAPLRVPARFRVLLLFSVWPASFVLLAGYSDSLTVALVVWAIALAREARWEFAALCGFLAGAARPTGVLIFIPLAWVALRSRQIRAVSVFLTPLGFIGYWSWLRWSGRPSVVEAYSLYQGMRFAPPWKGLTEVLRLIVSRHDELLAIKLAIVVLALLIILWPHTRSDIRDAIRIEDKAFAIAVVLQMLMYTGRPLLGAARYVLMLYPAFLAFGAYAEGWNRRQVLFYCAALGFLNLAWMRAFFDWSLVL